MKVQAYAITYIYIKDAMNIDPTLCCNIQNICYATSNDGSEIKLVMV